MILVPVAAYVVLTSLITLTALHPDLELPERIVTFVVFETVAILILLVGGTLYTVLSLYLGKSKTFCTEHILTLAEDSFIAETKFNKTEYKWTAVHKLRRTSNYMFLFTGPHAAHVVPRRAFVGDQEYLAFCQYCATVISKVEEADND
jgi:hypothetical protein